MVLKAFSPTPCVMSGGYTCSHVSVRSILQPLGWHNSAHLQRRREDMAPQMSKTAAAAAAVAGTAFVALPAQGADDCGCPADRIFGDLQVF